MPNIEQTNRVIDFQEFNPQAPDLLTIIGEMKGYESISDEKVKEVNEKLLVANFQEFITKFAPTVYSFYNSNTQNVAYTLKRPEGVPEESVTAIPLNIDNEFIKMVTTLIDSRGATGQKNVDFNYENIVSLLSPAKIMDDIRQTRKEIHYLYDMYSSIEEGDPKQLDVADKLNERFEMASQNYNNVMSLLPIAIEDAKQKLLLGASDGEESSGAVTAGSLVIDDTGELKIIEASKTDETKLMVVDDESQKALSNYFAEDYEEVSEAPTDYVRELVVRTFAPLSVKSNQEMNYELEVSNYNGYLEFYKNSKEEFVKTVKPLVEKIVGVKLFFDQYTTKNQVMPPKLLITNNKLEMLVKSSNLPRLEKYLNSVNNKNEFTNTIWFGIVSNVELGGEGKVKISRERFKGSGKAAKNVENTMEATGILLNTLKDYGIQLFFNFETSEETTFDHLATKGVESYIERCKPFTKRDFSAYAIPCYPNFTIIPKNRSGVLLDRKMVHEGDGVKLSEESEDYMRLWLEGVYAPAAYVAAGMCAAWQCPGYLKSYFKNVHKEYPGVRFDIEAKDHSLKVLSTMAKEISGFTNNVKSEINRVNFGFAFASENATSHGREVSNISVYKARSLAEGPNGFEELYKTLVSTYIERVLRYQSNDFKMDNIMHFFSNNPASTRSMWLNNKSSVNSIIGEGDDMGYNIDEGHNICEVDLMFNGNIKNLEVAINKAVNSA